MQDILLRPSCLLLLPSGKDSRHVRDAVKAAAKEAGVRLLPPPTESFPLFIEEEVIPEVMTKADLVVADISHGQPNIFYEVGVSHAMGKPTVFLSEEGVSPSRFPLHGISRGIYLTYDKTPDGMKKLQRRLERILTDFRMFPRKFQPSPFVLREMVRTPLIDLEKLEPREFENLCFELLKQMGYRQVEWGRELREIDVVATLPKRDPDGFEYQELWFISMGFHAPVGLILDRLFRDPDYLFHRLLPRFELGELSPLTLRRDTPITVLFILFREHPPAGAVDEQFKRLDRRLKEARLPVALRLRVWDREQLTRLIRQYPQIAYKYFSEEGRAQSRYRKTPEELYKENVALNERLQVAVGALKEEKDKRVRAERDAIWKDLSFTAAHKLGNPIFALETDLQGLKRRVEGKADAVTVANEMGKSVEKAKVIIEEFKFLTKAQDVSPEPVEILPLVESACRIAKQSDVEVNIQARDQEVLAKADPIRISQCFDELVRNSLKWFDKVQKQISVDLRVVKRKEVPGGLDSSRAYMRVSFEDNGVGVPAENKQRIFDPFFTTDPHGTGLGLSVVQRIIEGHNGLIVESGTLGTGAVFEVYLPTHSKA